MGSIRDDHGVTWPLNSSGREKLSEVGAKTFSALPSNVRLLQATWKKFGKKLPRVLPMMEAEHLSRVINRSGSPAPGPDGICSQAYRATVELSSQLLSRAAKDLARGAAALLVLTTPS